MNATLAISAGLMGLAGSWHCAAMCGASSAAVVGGCAGGVSGLGRRGSPMATAWAFLAGRLLGYAAAGALVASSVAVLAALGQWSPALRPLWVLVQAAALGLGLWLLWTGRQPGWLAQWGRGGTRAVATSAAGGWQRMQGPVRGLAAGSAWVAWPCGLLHSALLVAALANGPVGGAAVMAAFALGSSVGLLGVGPVAGAVVSSWRRRSRQLRGRPAGQDSGNAAGGAEVSSLPVRLGGGEVPAALARLGGLDVSAALVRLAGAALAGGAGWALGHGLWMKVVALCLPSGAPTL